MPRPAPPAPVLARLGLPVALAALSACGPTPNPPDSDAIADDGTTGAGWAARFGWDAAWPRPTRGPDTGDTADTGDSADSGAGSNDSGDTGTTDTGTDTDVDSGADSGAETGTDSGGTGDSGTPDTGAPDTGATDTGAPDTGAPDTGATDTGAPADTAPTDTAVDTGTSPVDTADTADTAPVDTADTGTPADTAPADTATPDTATPADTADTADTAPVDTADTGTPASTPLRFVAMGDAGRGNANQYAVAAAVEAVCLVEGCDFALYLGDNFYPNGVVDVADPLWTTNFEDVYASLWFPFYPALGNHDYNHALDVTRAQAQVDYSAYSSLWSMPDIYYDQVLGDATFFALDTQAIDLGAGAAQEAWIAAATAAASTTWKIAYGHHPYISNGPHGNAGEYDGRLGSGAAVESFVSTYVCGQIDVYLCGHDHSLQWLEETCGTHFIVSGGGSDPSILGGTNATYFEDASSGFLWVELDGNQFTGVFYDESGTELFRQSFTK